MAHTLILGAGFGGITVATELRRLLGDDHEVTLVDRGERFAMGLRKLWAVVDIGTYEEGSRPLSLLETHGVEVLQREILTIHPVGRRIETDQGSLEGDFLVVALGAEPRPDLVPGASEHAHNVWSPAGVPGLKRALAQIERGRIGLVIAGVPYSCPPAPYECAMLIDDHLRERGVREAVEVTIVTLQPMLLPNAGRAGSKWLAERLESKGIGFEVGRRIERFEPGRAVFADGVLEADLWIVVPPHRAPAVVRESGLTEEGEWIQVDRRTMETGFQHVYAVGDVTQIKLANGLPLPKAGLIAELQGQAVAASIAAEVGNRQLTAGFDGHGYCYLEMGKLEATMIEGYFYAEPEPEVRIGEISGHTRDDKHRFEAERLAKWFGG